MDMTNLNTPVEIFSRLGFAVLTGFILGLNRWLNHKDAGIRTHSLVSIGAAIAMMLISGLSSEESQAYSRVLQGLITGVGFLGAGVILRENRTQRIHGLTTAASIWVCALVGATFGAGQFVLGLSTLLVILFVLIVGGKVELWLSKLLNIKMDSEEFRQNNKD
jgi:putative Mg2+ transporter-C (MgtC) family protein